MQENKVECAYVYEMCFCVSIYSNETTFSFKMSWVYYDVTIITGQSVDLYMTK